MRGNGNNWLTGRNYELRVAQALRDRGFTVVGFNTRKTGLEIDIEAISPSGALVWIECKGSGTGPSKRARGLQCGDAAKKATGVAFCLRHSAPHLYEDGVRYIIVSEELPEQGSIAQRIIHDALSARLFDGVFTCAGLAAGLADF